MASDAGTKPQKEINRLKGQIKRLEKDREKLFPDIGRAAYQAFLEGRLSDQGLQELCARVSDLDARVEQAGAQIAALQSQIQQMKAGPVQPTASCPSCGAVVAPGRRFCGNCGAQLAAQAPPAQQSSVCPSCGSAVAPGARFCGECGKPFEEAAPPPRPDYAPPVAAPPAGGPPPPPPPLTGAPAGSAASPPPPPPAPETAAPTRSACPSCGAAVEEQGAAFCGECGASLE